MAIGSKPRLLTLEFRFTTDEDRERYGAQWTAYDENALFQRKAQELVKWEGEIGLSIVDIMNGVRGDSVIGDTCAMWLGLKLAGHEVRFSDFNPAVMLAEWRVPLAPVDLGKAPAPDRDSESDSASHQPPTDGTPPDTSPVE